MQLAPIVLFAYNRPWHVKQTLQSLSENFLAQESDLYIYCDGPKEGSLAEVLTRIQEVRSVIREKKWCKTVTIIESETNKGLANSIIEGVTTIVKKFTKVIVIEDDVLLSPYFLKFMNDSLEKYKDNSKVLSVGSWNYFCKPELLKDNFFYRFPDSIAWGTFDRAWEIFEKDANLALKKITDKNLEDKLNGGLSFPYFTNMLQLQIDGKINSWAIRWTATAIINDMLSFFPKQTLSKHIGFGDGATHETGESDYNSHLALAEKEITLKEMEIKEDQIAIAEWRKFIRSHFVPKKIFKTEFKNILKKILPKFVVTLLSKK